jgi:hypothetical protein
MDPSPLYKNLPLGGVPVLLFEGVSISRSETGFDRMTKKYFARTANPATYATTYFPAAQVESATADGIYGNMFCTNVSIERVGKDSNIFTVEYSGLLTSQAVKRTVSSKSQSYSAGSITVDGVLRDKVQGTYTNLSCTFSYVTTGMPSTNVTPTTPPAGGAFPGFPPNPFGSVPANAVYNYPWGWVMEGREVDMINNASLTTSIFMVKEDWAYIYQYMPG